MADSKKPLEKRESIFQQEKSAKQRAIEWLRKQKENEHN